MPVFDYREPGDPRDAGIYPQTYHCDYCGTQMPEIQVEGNIGTINTSDLLIDEETRTHYKEQGLEECHLNLRPQYDDDYERVLYYCTVCGWWKYVKSILIPAEAWQVWQSFYGCTGVLKNLDLNDIRTPVSEVRSYLSARYEKRFSVNPRLFEQTVASVFRDFGYKVHVTGYSNDGGIDAVLYDPSQNMVGVQVKRYRNKIEADQIRAFAGALMLDDYQKGIFVTTSGYRPGAIETARKVSAESAPVILMNADEFYHALKLVQREKVDTDGILGRIKDAGLFSYGVEWPLNSL